MLRKELMRFQNQAQPIVDEGEDVDTLPEEGEEEILEEEVDPNETEAEREEGEDVDDLPDEDEEEEEEEKSDREKFDEASKDSEEEVLEEEDGKESEVLPDKDQEDEDMELDVEVLPDHLTDDQKALINQIKNAFFIQGRKQGGSILLKPILNKILGASKGFVWLADNTQLGLDIAGYIVKIPNKLQNWGIKMFKDQALEKLEKELATTTGAAAVSRIKEAIKYIKTGKTNLAYLKNIFSIAQGTLKTVINGTFAKLYIAKSALTAVKTVAKTKIAKQFVKFMTKRAIPIISGLVGGVDVFIENRAKGKSSLESALFAFAATSEFVALDVAVIAGQAKALIATGGVASPAIIVVGFLTQFFGALQIWDWNTGNKTITSLPKLLKDYYDDPQPYNEAVIAWLEEKYDTLAGLGLGNIEEKGSEGGTKDPAGNPPSVHSPGGGGGGPGGQVYPTDGRPGGGMFSRSAKAPLDEKFISNTPVRFTQSLLDEFRKLKKKQPQKKSGRSQSLIDQSKKLREETKPTKERKKAINDYITGQGG